MKAQQQISVIQVRESLRFQSREARRTILVLFLLSVLLVLGMALAGVLLDIPVGNLTRDPMAVLEAPWYVGLLSNLGVVLWAAAAAIALFAAAVRGAPRGAMDRQVTEFLIVGGLISAGLMLDDLFQIHEQLLPASPLLSESLMIGMWMLLVGAWVLHYRQIVVRTENVLLALALAAFAISLLMDGVVLALGNTGVSWTGPVWAENLYFILEDGAKFLGIVFWLAYLARASRQCLVRPAVQENARSAFHVHR